MYRNISIIKGKRYFIAKIYSNTKNLCNDFLLNRTYCNGIGTQFRIET